MQRPGGHLLEVVVYERFQYEALTENIFAVFGRRLPTQGLTVLFCCAYTPNVCDPVKQARGYTNATDDGPYRTLTGKFV